LPSPSLAARRFPANRHTLPLHRRAHPPFRGSTEPRGAGTIAIAAAELGTGAPALRVDGLGVDLSGLRLEAAAESGPLPPTLSEVEAKYGAKLDRMMSNLGKR